MAKRFTKWFSKFWKLFLGLAAVIAALRGGFELKKDIDEIRATPTLTPTILPANTPKPAYTPLFTPTYTPGPFLFIKLPQKVIPGDNVTLVVQALKDTSCHLDYFTPKGNLSSASGLGSVSPDSRGQCTWEWHIRADTSPGIGKLVIQINDLKETHEIEIRPPE